MANIYLFKKFLYFTVVVGLLPTLAQTTDITQTRSILSTVVIGIFMFITVLPEFSLIFPGYRREVLNGIQDGDGSTNREDLRFFASWYTVFSSGRAIVFMVLFSMVEDWSPPSEIIWALVTIAGGASITQVKSLFSKSP